MSKLCCSLLLLLLLLRSHCLCEKCKCYLWESNFYNFIMFHLHQMRVQRDGVACKCGTPSCPLNKGLACVGGWVVELCVLHNLRLADDPLSAGATF